MIFKSRTWRILLIFKWRVCPCGRVIVAMAADWADDVTKANFGFKQFVTAAGIYATTNPLW